MKNAIKPPRLKFGDTIGIIAPAIALKPEYIQNSVQKLVSLGFKVKLSDYLFSTSFGYSGSIEERTKDFNTMIADDDVRMILFGGGEVSNEILPFIDYKSIIEHPKILCSYSDSTTLLNAIQYMTGLITFYGASLRTFEDLTEYNWQSFKNRLMTEECRYIKAGEWKTIYPGVCEGVLAGGYLVNYAALQGLEFYKSMPDDSCILFLEDHERFNSPAAVSKWFSNLMQRGVFKRVSGVIFGHYSANDNPLIDQILYRVGEQYHIPVAKCEDFGHGINNSILPIGMKAKLDTQDRSFKFLENCVS